MNILFEEFKLNNYLINLIQNLEPNVVCIDIIYKLALFTDLFYCRICPDEIIYLFNSLNSQKNIYSKNLEASILSTLELLYINKSMQSDSEYYSMYKFSNGITIYYIDETLSNILGCQQKALLKASIENIMPKELSIPHTLAVKRDLIIDKNRYINSESFLFDKDMQMFSMSIDGASIIGLGKYFFCILRAIMTEKENVFYFYLDKNFECVSLSHNFNNYQISLDF